ncbi:hypothetical protein [Chelativorans sp. M5D2P16]|uniref:hypothetical protein n=1 Tax=Chelativorans sp. M5D2P16 TaxID=3095678 RepID=UPI002ACA8E19|nr:hypothetical protein [Chelativorans sp. M5D2P16]MDZ5697825.1 hypothetical protein [Chelativorans sp. M5D2P16]
MVDIDHAAFARAVRAKLKRRGLSFDRAVDRWPALDKAMLSRACTEKRLSAGNFLLLCEALKLDPYRFLMREKGKRLRMRDIAKRLSSQSVTQVDKRETREGAR